MAETITDSGSFFLTIAITSSLVSGFPAFCATAAVNPRAITTVAMHHFVFVITGSLISFPSLLQVAGPWIEKIPFGSGHGKLQAVVRVDELAVVVTLRWLHPDKQAAALHVGADEYVHVLAAASIEAIAGQVGVIFPNDRLQVRIQRVSRPKLAEVDRIAIRQPVRRVAVAHIAVPDRIVEPENRAGRLTRRSERERLQSRTCHWA